MSGQASLPTSAFSDESVFPITGVDLSLSTTCIQNIIFDLGDVVFTWSPSSPASPLPPHMLKQILRSASWFEYEKGNITEEQVYAQAAKEFNLSASDIADALGAARESLQSNPALLKVIRDLKISGRNIFAMSNISKPDWEVLMTKVDPSVWALFDKVFTSAEARERKPNLGFYRHLITHSGIDPTGTIFIDDKVENVLTARSFGMHGIVFNDLENVVRQLINICGDPVERAQSFLEANKKLLSSVTSCGVVLHENFAQLLILEATGDNALVDYIEYSGLHNFFQSGGTLTTQDFPDDIDTTSVGLTLASHVDPATRERVMNHMLSFCNNDGILQVYFDHSRPRIDPIVCVNALTLFYRNGRGQELDCSMNWVEQVLFHRAYMDGTLYYSTPEAFLFFFSRLLQSSQALQHRLAPLFRRRVTERFGAEGDSLALAMRVIAAASVGLIDRLDLNRLLSLQQQDGSWVDGWFYKYGSSGRLLRNDGVTTALGIRAIQAVRRLEVMGRDV